MVARKMAHHMTIILVQLRGDFSSRQKLELQRLVKMNRYLMLKDQKEDRCELTRTPYGRCFICKELNLYLQFLFELIVDLGPSVGLDVTLNRFDLFHGHLFLTVDSGRLRILYVKLLIVIPFSVYVIFCPPCYLLRWI
ncbi:hypothetical protein E2542_SST25937 [Spatholobus suberectus]|nr:hypothetical protein E2542_SST25937 [Spatholobus suberectus]